MIKKLNEGITSQNMLVDKSAILPMSLLSIYIQIKARIEIKGKDANILPINELRLPISEMATSIMDELMILII